jgi:hypothetical protein
MAGERLIQTRYQIMDCTSRYDCEIRSMSEKPNCWRLSGVAARPQHYGIANFQKNGAVQARRTAPHPPPKISSSRGGRQYSDATNRDCPCRARGASASSSRRRNHERSRRRLRTSGGGTCGRRSDGVHQTIVRRKSEAPILAIGVADVAVGEFGGGGVGHGDRRQVHPVVGGEYWKRRYSGRRNNGYADNGTQKALHRRQFA